jgi:hypothetical protein
MTKKVRIIAWQEQEDSATNMASCLGCQKLTKEYPAGPSVSMPRRITVIIKNGKDVP